MEALYAKLYDKYVKLKKDKESQFDNVNREQEVKFINYAAAADEMIQYLKSENDGLYRQVEELKSELTSIRSSSDEQHTHDQKLLMEEKRKCKELSEEIARLGKLKETDRSRCTVDATGAEVENSSGDTPAEKTPNKPAETLLKKRKLTHNAEVSTTEYNNEVVYRPSNTHVDQGTGLPPIIQQPICCQTRIQVSGGDATDTSSVNCMFQNLAELLVGMKVSAVYQNKEPSIIVHHKSTGYSFSLTWINNSKGEAELLYTALSLGTFERVAPEFMKETIIFSTSMCGVFFERVSRVIKS